MPTKLILIRHGITEWNIEKKYCGLIDIGLSTQGIEQIKRLRDRLKEEEVHKVYASDRKRAIHSARIIFKKTKIELMPELKEIHFGVLEGLTHQEILQRHPQEYRKWLKDPFRFNIPNAESLKEFKKRITRAIKKIATLNKNKTVAVVCHGGSISAYINHILKPKKFWKHIPKPASINIVEYSGGKAKIRSFNDTAHLNE